MKRLSASLACLALAMGLAPACGGGFPTIGHGKKLVVAITQGNLGSVQNPLPIEIAQPTPFTVRIEAHNPDGSIDTTFDGYVGLHVQPGTITDISVRNVKLSAGIAGGVVVPIVGAFGEAHIWADDLGYEPALPDRKPPPQCSDGIDNNHDGLIDYPADPGCYAPVDDTEAGGSYAAGATDTVYFQLPRISLVRGYDPEPGANGNGNATLFPQQQLRIDTGWRGGSNYAFNTVITGLTSSGFYVQDLQNDLSSAPGYGGIFMYNYSTPPFMRVCDRVQILSGTASDFYGYTELNYPTWQLEFWDPKARPCLVPEPTVPDSVAELNDPNWLWKNEATLVRVQTAGNVNVHVSKHFGPDNVPLVNGAYVPSDNASNCDFNHTGKIDFTDPREAACIAACVGSCTTAPTDFECSEWSSFQGYNSFNLIVTETANACSSEADCATGFLCTAGKCVAQARFNANSAAANLFDPATARGQTIRSFTGVISYFSGGCQFTSNARCQDDVVVDMNSQPLPSNVACVHPRTQSDLNANSQ